MAAGTVIVLTLGGRPVPQYAGRIIAVAYCTDRLVTSMGTLTPRALVITPTGMIPVDQSQQEVDMLLAEALALVDDSPRFRTPTTVGPTGDEAEF